MLLKTDGFGQLQILTKRASGEDSVFRRVGSDGPRSDVRKVSRLRVRRLEGKKSQQYPKGIKSLRAALLKGPIDKARARRSLRSQFDQKAARKNQRLEKARSRITSPTKTAPKPLAPRLRTPFGTTRTSKSSVTSPIETSTASNLELTRKFKPIVQHQC